jgi:butyryl-CoA dehydrogenase
MHDATIVSERLADARAFADSVAGVVARHRDDHGPGWSPGIEDDGASSDGLAEALHELGWTSVAGDPELVACAGLAGVELGHATAPVAELDRLLGAAPMAGELIRCPVAGDGCLQRIGDELVRRAVLAAEPCPSPEGLHVLRVTSAGPPEPVDVDAWAIAWPAWLAASTGYLAGLGEAALGLTVDYVRGRAAFGATLGALAPVQQLLAGAATAVRGVALLCADGPDADALRHAGPAVREACDACHQVSGAIGYTLEYPLHRFSQRARALATWNDAVLDALDGRRLELTAAQPLVAAPPDVADVADVPAPAGSTGSASGSSGK